VSAPDPPGDTVAARLDRLAAAAQIRQLPARYASYLDSRDVDSLVGLFVHNVRVGGGRYGRAALREVFFDESLHRIGVTILHAGNHVIDFDGPDRARGLVYCHAEIQTGAHDLITQAICYRDGYARHDGRWYFPHRDHLLYYGVRYGQRPIGLPPADWPASDVGLGTVPQAWPTWTAFWDDGRRNGMTGPSAPDRATMPAPGMTALGTDRHDC